jgi:hypothetical protein
LLIFISACSSGATSTTEAPATTIAPSTNTTVASLFNPPSGEQRINCDSQTIGKQFGEKVILEGCTNTWAIGDTDRDTWNCPEEGCPQTRLFHLSEGEWVTTAICDRRFPLTRYASSCYVPNVGLANLSLIPPRDVACLLWPANSQLRFITETECTPDLASIVQQLDTACESYFVPQELPMQKCAQGEPVRLVQAAMKTLGYMINIDNYFGPQLAQQIYEFQGVQKFLQTGAVDEATWRALFPDQSVLPGTDRNNDGLITPNEF